MALQQGTLYHVRQAARAVASSKGQSAALLAALSATALVSPPVADIAAVAGLWFVLMRHRALPRSLRTIDRPGPRRTGFGAFLDRVMPPAQPAPDRAYVIGHDNHDGTELAMTKEDLRQHMLVLGTTGAGKTEGLLGMSESVVAKGSGMIYIDGKGDVSLFAKVFGMARKYGREDDVLALDLMHRAGGGGTAASNATNPFAAGSAYALAQVLLDLVVDERDAPWAPDARRLASAVMQALVHLRDERGEDLNTKTVRDAIGFRALLDLADPGGRGAVLPQEARAAVEEYLAGLPGYNPERGARQAQSVLDAHGSLEMQFTRILGLLADCYGHIYNAASEIDMHDVVANRRILVVTLPSLERGSDEIAALGRLVMATLRAMMGAALGSHVDGKASDLDAMPNHGRDPFLCVADEVGYYALEGFGLMAAQARSLGFAMVYGAQDVPSLKRSAPLEADSIIANTNTKVFMRMEADEIAGQDLMTPGMRAIGVDPLRFRSFEAGEMVMLHKDQVINGRMIYRDFRDFARRGPIRTGRFTGLDALPPKR